jgi:arsenite/tail-anchored protein-transporting ATPase
VGKTTTAGAIALASADGGARTCLISTDPAHSLGDLFDVPISQGSPISSPCSDRLVIEELDAQGYAHAWMERARAPLLALFDQGTYLDAEDLEGFLDLALPGVDEVAGVLRLAELSEERFERVVVDTAPTGHTLRMLDAGEVVRSWSAAFDAMAEKAAAVISQLTRRSVRFEADDVIQDLRARVAAFDERVLARGQAVLVSREGSVVEAETERLAAALAERGLPVAMRVRVEQDRPGSSPAGSPVVPVHFHPGLRGCDGLRRWGGGAPAVPRVETARGGGAEALLVDTPPLLLFVGKGGVGKSTCAAAAALALSERGEVVLLGTDPAGSLGDVLGTDVREGVAHPAPNLTVRQVRAAEEFQAFSARYHESIEDAFVALGLERSAALDRRVLDSLLGLAPPGLDEVFAVSALLDDVGELSGGRRVVVDTAPTGHFLRLLGMPELALGWTHQLLRVIRKYRAALGLDAFAERLLDLAKQLRELKLTLSDPERCGAIVVTQPGPLVSAESRRLMGRIRDAGVRLAAVVTNRSDAADPSLQIPAGVAVVRAPALEEPPVGAPALLAFLRGWTVDAR